MVIGQEMGDEAVVKTDVSMQKMYGPQSRKMGEETVVKISCSDKKKIMLVLGASQKTKTTICLLLSCAK